MTMIGKLFVRSTFYNFGIKPSLGKWYEFWSFPPSLFSVHVLTRGGRVPPPRSHSMTGAETGSPVRRAVGRRSAPVADLPRPCAPGPTTGAPRPRPVALPAGRPPTKG